MRHETKDCKQDTHCKRCVQKLTCDVRQYKDNQYKQNDCTEHSLLIIPNN
ncbi:hypothetical protein adrianh_13 [Escherichia phage adrianh]|uniref:Uncharacterized protein n=1 Tax=Escherichia phage adrianh TaxID=2696377 RepID=A0A6B9WYI4_9CAUD|nr:hypothetical protein adrianh_13 [Escherichia phage adrianh]